MKIQLTALLAGAALAGAAGAAHAADWQLIGSTGGGGLIAFGLPSSVVHETGERTGGRIFWVKEFDQQANHTVVMHAEADCGAGGIRPLSAVIYNANGGVIADVETPEGWTVAVPGSLNESMVGWACSR